MASLTFSQVDGKYETSDVQFETDAVLELNFDAIPELTGVQIEIYQSLTKTGWQLAYNETLRSGLTFCKTLVGVSEKAYYKIVSTVNPTSASYE